MDLSAKNELISIKSELNLIIAELESISQGIRNDFIGIGNEKCADCIDNVLTQYYFVRRKLNNIDTSMVTDSFIQPQVNNGGGGFR